MKINVGDILQMFYPGDDALCVKYKVENKEFSMKEGVLLLHPNSKIEFKYLNREGRDKSYIRVSKLIKKLEDGSITILGDYQIVSKTNLKHKFI